MVQSHLAHWRRGQSQASADPATGSHELSPLCRPLCLSVSSFSLCKLAGSLFHAHTDSILASQNVQFSADADQPPWIPILMPMGQIWPIWGQLFFLSLISWSQGRSVIYYESGHRSPHNGCSRSSPAWEGDSMVSGSSLSNGSPWPSNPGSHSFV